MKTRGQVIQDDGFEKNVAEKMPRVKRLEEPLSSNIESKPQLHKDEHPEMKDEMSSSEERAEKKAIFKLSERGVETGPNLDVFRLIEDLHTQLLASSRTKRALEMDLSSYEKTIQQLAQDNNDLSYQLENLRKEFQKLEEIHSESIYLKEENADALGRIQEFQQEMRSMKEALSQATQERDKALSHIEELESQIEQNGLLQIKGRLKEREVAHFSEENRELQSKLEEALAHNMDLEKKYETLKRSFHEVRESLSLLRDSCKTNYYNLSQNPE
jgi:chromosome segregation ATPase